MKPHLLKRFAEILPEQTDLLPHLEWRLGNLHIETIQALYSLCRAIEPDELELLLLTMEANRVLYARLRPDLVSLTPMERRVLRGAMGGVSRTKIARALRISENAHL